MRSICTLSLLAASLLALPAYAADAQSAPKAASAPAAAPAASAPAAMIAGSIDFEATIVSVDAKTRVVTIRTKQNETIQVTAGEEVHNFDQLHPGDIISGKYAEAVALQLNKVKGEAHTTVDTAVGRAPKGKKPGGTFERQVSFIADVTAVDAATKKVSIKGAGGHVVAITVNDAAKLAEIKVGDQVQGVFAQSLDLTVTAKGSKSSAKPKK
jgi:Cu/Ag efflux protein CusF